MKRMVESMQMSIDSKSDIANSLLTNSSKNCVSRLLETTRAQSRDTVARQDRDGRRHDRIIRRQHVDGLLEEERRSYGQSLGTDQQ